MLANFLLLVPLMLAQLQGEDDCKFDFERLEKTRLIVIEPLQVSEQIDRVTRLGCELRCCQHPKCESYVYEPNSEACILSSDIVGLDDRVHDGGFHSGMKRKRSSTAVMTRLGCACQFPFRYHGRTYHNCTNAGVLIDQEHAHTAWCHTGPDCGHEYEAATHPHAAAEETCCYDICVDSGMKTVLKENPRIATAFESAAGELLILSGLPSDFSFDKHLLSEESGLLLLLYSPSTASSVKQVEAFAAAALALSKGGGSSQMQLAVMNTESREESSTTYQAALKAVSLAGRLPFVLSAVLLPIPEASFFFVSVS